MQKVNQNTVLQSEQIKQDIKIADKYRWVEGKLKYYGLLKQDNHIFDKTHLNLSHFDIDMPEGSTYRERVEKWFDFVTTLHIEAGIEPLFMYNEAIPTVRQILRMVAGVNAKECDTCLGKGQIIIPETVTQYRICPDCLGLGIHI